MRISKTWIVAPLSFAAGGFAAHLLMPAFAQTVAAPPLQAQVIDIGALDGESIGPIVPNTELRTKLLIATDHATVAVQQGNIGKHYHAGNDEIQYILSGSGTMWIGDAQRAVKAGDLVVIPKGMNHAGTIATSGTFKALAIKIPPQAAGDTHFVQ